MSLQIPNRKMLSNFSILSGIYNSLRDNFVVSVVENKENKGASCLLKS